MSDIEINELLNKKVKVLFGLEAQGHIPLIEERIKGWRPSLFDKNSFQIWKDIAKEIGWIDHAVCGSYIKHLQKEVNNSTPNTKIQELIDYIQNEYKDNRRTPDYYEALDLCIFELKELIGDSK